MRKMMIDGVLHEVDDQTAKTLARLVRERDAALAGKKALERKPNVVVSHKKPPGDTPGVFTRLWNFFSRGD